MSAFIALLSFMIVASPTAFRTTRGFFGEWISSPEGLATFKGLFLHAIVFLLLVCILSMFFKTSSDYLTDTGLKFVNRDEHDEQITMRFQQNRFVN